MVLRWRRVGGFISIYKYFRKSICEGGVIDWDGGNEEGLRLGLGDLRDGIGYVECEVFGR